MYQQLRTLWVAPLLLTPIYSPSSQADTQLAPLMVSATRSEQVNPLIPASIQVIDRQQIERSAANNLLQLLNGQSGIQISSLVGDGSQAVVDMRGFGPTAGANTLILVDGRRLNNSGDRANPDLNSIDLRRVERIEIVQGSAGTLFGNQAVGGMINIITRVPEKLSGQVSAGVGSDHHTNLHAGIGDQLDNGLSYNLSAQQKKSDNYREQNEIERTDLNLRADYRHRLGKLFFEQQWIDDEQENPGSLFAEELAADRRQSADAYDGDYSNTESSVSRLGVSQDLNDQWSLEGELTYRKNEREFQNSFRTFPGSPATQDRTVKSFNPRLIGSLSLPTGDALITAGADLERTDYELRTSFGPQILDQSIDAVYLQLLAPVNEETTLTLGYRHARVDNQIETGSGSDRLDDRVDAASAGLNYTPNKQLRLFLRADENYRFATVDEHTNVVFGQPVGIDNQTGRSYESGIEWQQGQLTTQLLVYRLDLEQEISFDASGFVNTNLEETRRRGASLEAQWQVTEQLSLDGSLSYTDPQITDGPFKGNRIPMVASRSAKLAGHWQFTSAWNLFMEGVFSSERVVSGDFNNALETLPGYGVLNSGAHFRTGPWHASLRIDNLLDKQYANSAAAGFDSTFTQRVGYFPAPERNFWLTVNYLIE
ncbi:MAG: TonB-dependent receptor [Candidatus Thiodiazotropha taylori]|nr:TonB-dependent receptor [Candidatus Thiodiazotropha taylori]MCW4233955.1 TonB-dependent receptor [Candidatus Thiodiazotropha taylori]